MRPGPGDPLVMELTHGLDGGHRLAEQDGVAHEAKDTIRAAVGGAYIDDRGSRPMTIAADQHMRVGPVAPERRQQPDHNHRIVSPRRTGARAEAGHDEGRRRPLNNDERPRAVVLIEMMIERTRLLAIRRIIGVVQIQDSRGRRCSVAGDAMIHQGPSEPLEILLVHLVLQARERWGAGSIVGRVQGRPLAPECEPGGTAEALASLASAYPAAM